MGHYDKIRVLRQTAVSTDEGGSANGAPQCVLETTTTVKVLQPSRKLEALQDRLKNAIEFSLWSKPGFALEPDDTIEWDGKRYSPQGPAMATGRLKRMITIIAVQQ